MLRTCLKISIKILSYQRKFISKLMKIWRTSFIRYFNFHVNICFLNQIFSLCYLFFRHAFYINVTNMFENFDRDFILSARIHIEINKSLTHIVYKHFDLYVDICSLNQIFSLCYLFFRHMSYIIFDLHRDERCKFHIRYHDQRIERNKIVVNSWRLHLQHKIQSICDDDVFNAIFY